MGIMLYFCTEFLRHPDHLPVYTVQGQSVSLLSLTAYEGLKSKDLGGHRQSSFCTDTSLNFEAVVGSFQNIEVPDVSLFLSFQHLVLHIWSLCGGAKPPALGVDL